MIRNIITMLILIGIGWANLLTNPDFEQPITTGWTQAYTTVSYTIDRQTTYQPDPDYEAGVQTGSGSGYATLYQTVDIPSTNVNFSADVKVYAYDNHSSAWAGAAIQIVYLNSSGTRLGETRIFYGSTQCPWTNSSTMHAISAIDSLWHTYSFNVASELSTYLPGVNPANVARIKVALFDSTYHC